MISISVEPGDSIHFPGYNFMCLPNKSNKCEIILHNREVIKPDSNGMGIIFGKTLDENDDAIPGVPVIILESEFRADSDFNGNYIISNIPPGKYKISANTVGFYKIISKEIIISSGSIININFILASKPIQGSGTYVI